jgi:hypothetical protein
MTSSTPSSICPVWRILYIDEIEENHSQQILEAGVADIEPSCAFEVVSNSFSGLERLETSEYNMILMKQDLESFNADQVTQFLRNIAVHIPIVRLVRRKRNGIHSGFCIHQNGQLLLYTPFTFSDLKLTISYCMRLVFGANYQPIQSEPIILIPPIINESISDLFANENDSQLQ